MRYRFLLLKCLTVCAIVPEGDTCAGAGTAKPSNQPVLDDRPGKKAKACETAWDVRTPPKAAVPSACPRRSSEGQAVRPT
ncbi:MAG: hypothetical protein KJZ72_21475 [Anaerolineales bacterium]|nr:hypothetical protein [Anaerolineales bacterium]